MADGSAVRLRTASLGYPAIGGARELKIALEARFRGETTDDDLRAAAARLRAAHWRTQRDAGVDDVPCGDFSLYDRMLDLAFALGVVPERFAHLDPAALSTYFAVARGVSGARAADMTKWFDTNYHYVRPEFGSRAPRAVANPYLAAYYEAKACGVITRPALVGPATFLGLSTHDPARRGAIFESLVAAYVDLCAEFAREGVARVQIDEPILASGAPPEILRALPEAYRAIRAALPRAHLTLASYFGGYGAALATVAALPIDALHLDCTRAEDELDAAARALGDTRELSLGVIDGRNVWRADERRVGAWIARAAAVVGRGRLTLATSCSLMHAPTDLDAETKLAPELRARLAFARQKLDELRRFAEHAPSIAGDAPRAYASNGVAPARPTPEAPMRGERRERVRRQNAALGLPPLPTTTIGSLPQTPEVRRMRALARKGEIDARAYDAYILEATADAIARQERAGLDVLVHGEFERNDMVEFFGERLAGFATSEHGWVVSYGSRCVKPPILHGAVARRGPLTVELARRAQSLSAKPVKGMLTGPVTILQWSFVRDDQPRADTAFDVARALAEEVADLARAGVRVVQIDEPGLREGLPPRAEERATYLAWATRAFRASFSGAGDATQIHTHMCYADFIDVLEAVAELDADVVTFEAARSGLELLPHLAAAAPEYQAGPGVFDIHSPIVPTRLELDERIRRVVAALGVENVWINPDCGLKTRTWEEVEASLRVMCGAAEAARAAVAATA